MCPVIDSVYRKVNENLLLGKQPVNNSRPDPSDTLHIDTIRSARHPTGMYTRSTARSKDH